MTLELHVWGPAFSLPSIDPHCLAAIAYLTQAVAREQWTLVASDDVTLSPTINRITIIHSGHTANVTPVLPEELPALRDGSVWVGGFRNIIDHLSKSSDNKWDLDHSLDRKRRASVTAFSSFIESHGQPLLDLSLYVSSENYSSATRPAYSRFLPWPKPWLITPQRRTLAKARTAHLNLSALDIDNATNEEKYRISAKTGAGLIPTSLQSTRQTVSSLVKQPQHASRFRLDALSGAFFDPLQQLLGQKRFLLSDEDPSSLDCLALAYLALALLPEVPQPWLAESIETLYPQLCEYTRKSISGFFGGPTMAEDALPSPQSGDSEVVADTRGRSSEAKETSLPWSKPESEGIVATGLGLVETAFQVMPVLGRLHQSNVLLESGNRKTANVADRQSVQAVAASPPTPILPAILAIGTVVSGVAGYLFCSGLLNIPGSASQSPESKRLSDMGEVGMMLAMVDFGGRGSKLQAEDARPGRVPVGLEVDVASEKGAL